MQKCWDDGRDFYFVDSGYMGNTRGSKNNFFGWKVWHRIVKNNIQYAGPVLDRPVDRWNNLGITVKARKQSGGNILLCMPDEKPMRFYGLDLDQWQQKVVGEIKKYTNRPIVIRQRVQDRVQRMIREPLTKALEQAHCVVTFNSNAAIESIINGVPAFVLSPVHAAKPVANTNLSNIEKPFYPDTDLLHKWLRNLAYQQFHNSELENGSALRILNAN
jgi:hypothetical protein